MKKFYYIAYGASSLIVLSVFLPWIYPSNGGVYVYGYSLRVGSAGLLFIIISVLLLALKRIKASMMFSFISLIYSFSFLIGWVLEAHGFGSSNVFEGLSIGIFLFIISSLIYTITIWNIKNKRIGNNLNNKVNIKEYFYSNGKEKQGPFSFDELKNKNINKETLIWFKGLEDWKPATEIEELEEILQLIPPPIFTNESKSNPLVNESNKKNDNSDTKYENFSTSNPKKRGMFSKPFSFEGRIRRTEYGISLIIYVVVAIIINIFSRMGEQGPILNLLFIPLLWFIFAQGAKRCHDIDKNGLYQIIPFFIIWLIFAKGDLWINRYGAAPKILIL